MMAGDLGDHGAAMDRMYRIQRHIYDLTRKYYLLGRDRLVADLLPPKGGSVLELGCGTGRNLVSIGRAYPTARLYGVDISAEMLKSATAALDKAGLAARARVAVGDATAVDPHAAFPADGPAEGFDRVVLSYALSMIPDWEGAIAHGLRVTRPGGRLAIVDFGPCDRLPGLFQAGLYAWLARFHVTPRIDLPEAARRIAAESRCYAGVRHIHRGYATIVTIDRPLTKSTSQGPSGSGTV